MSTWWLWILAALVSGIIEVMIVSFVFLMLAIGALAAGIAAACGANLMVQLIVFIIVSVALLVVLRPFLKGRIERSNNYVPSNTDRLIGKSGYVTETVGERHGRIQFSGVNGAREPKGRSCPLVLRCALIVLMVRPPLSVLSA